MLISRVITSNNEHLIKYYRVPQLLNAFTNASMKLPFNFCFLSGTIIAEVSSLYVLITSLKQLPLEVAIFYLTIAFDFGVGIHVLGTYLSIPFLEGEEFRKNVTREWRAPPTKWFSRYLKSCPAIRLSMGDGSFYDSATSLVIWQFCVDQLVSLLLI